MIAAEHARSMVYDIYKDRFDRIEKDIIAAAKRGERSLDVEIPSIEDDNLYIYTQYLKEHGFIANYNYNKQIQTHIISIFW